MSKKEILDFDINEDEYNKFNNFLLKISEKLNPSKISGDTILIGNKNNYFLVIGGEFNVLEKISSIKATLFKLETDNVEAPTFKPSLFGHMYGLDLYSSNHGANILNYDEKELKTANKLLSSYLNK